MHSSKSASNDRANRGHHRRRALHPDHVRAQDRAAQHAQPDGDVHRERDGGAVRGEQGAVGRDVQAVAAGVSHVTAAQRCASQPRNLCWYQSCRVLADTLPWWRPQRKGCIVREATWRARSRSRRPQRLGPPTPMAPALVATGMWSTARGGRGDGGRAGRANGSRATQRVRLHQD